MMENKEITIADIDAAIKSAGSSFTLASVAKALGEPRSDRLRRRLERAIESDGEFFYDSKWHCCTRKSFFTGAKFLITPDEWEINEGVLFPGHRFVPFIPESIFPSDVELSMAGVAVAKRKQIFPLGQIFRYHLLLGSEQIFDFMIAEDPANAHLTGHPSASAQVTLELFDLAGFYRTSGFVFGDALLCCVDDYENGKISFSRLAGDERSSSGRRQYIAAMDEAMRQVWEKFGDYIDIPEQLAWAEFFAGQKSFFPGASLDEFITSSKCVELRPDGDHAVLSISGSDGGTQENEVTLPEGVTISTGELDDPVKILSGAGMPLSIPELEGFMLDAIYGRESDIDGVYSRIFGHKELDLADEAQQAVLLNFLEERFEDLLENYNRADDEPKAELRSQLLAAVSERLEYLAFLGSLDRDINDAEHEKLHELAEIGCKLGEVLKLLNNPAFTPEASELERIAALADERLDRQEELLGEFRSGDDSRNQ